MSLLRRRMMMQKTEEGEDMAKEWKLLAIIELTETQDKVDVQIPECEEVTIYARTKQEMVDGTEITGNKNAGINVNKQELLKNINNFSGTKSNTDSYVHIKSVGAFIEGTGVGVNDLNVSKNLCAQCRYVPAGVITEISITPEYKFVSGIGNAMRFSTGSIFEVYGR